MSDVRVLQCLTFQYDQIERDIGPWLGIAPEEFRRRRDKLEELGFS